MQSGGGSIRFQTFILFQRLINVEWSTDAKRKKITEHRCVGRRFMKLFRKIEFFFVTMAYLSDH